MNPAFFSPRKLLSLQPPPASVVGLVVSDVTNPFFAEVIPDIEECLDVAGFTTLLGNTCEDCAREARLLKTMRDLPPTGVLMCPSFGHDGLSAQPLRLVGRLPTVAFARPAGGLDYVGVNNVYGAELAVDHLYQNGHRKIAFVGGEPQAIATQERSDGWFPPLRAVAAVTGTRPAYCSWKILQLPPFASTIWWLLGSCKHFNKPAENPVQSSGSSGLMMFL
jgi:LacI family transcriptional regulator